MNKCLLSLVQHRGTVAVFAHPIDEMSRTGRDEQHLHFLGHYTAHTAEIGNNWDTKKIIDYATHLPSHKQGKTGKAKEALWLQADGNIRAFFKFAGIDCVNFDGNVGDDESELPSGTHKSSTGKSAQNKGGISESPAIEMCSN